MSEYAEPYCLARHPMTGVVCTKLPHPDEQIHHHREDVGPGSIWFADGHVPFLCKCHRTGCMYCDGGLFSCVRCNSFEGATTSECPGTLISSNMTALVYAGERDFRGGQWVVASSRHTPAYWRTPEGIAELEKYRQETAQDTAPRAASPRTLEEIRKAYHL